MLHIKLAQFAVWCALPPRRSESPICATDNKPSCVLHLLGWFIGSCGFSSLERRPEFWVLQEDLPNPVSASQADSLPSEPPGKPMNTGVGNLSLLQGIFLAQELNQGLLHCRRILYQLSYLGSQIIFTLVKLFQNTKRDI